MRFATIPKAFRVCRNKARRCLIAQRKVSQDECIRCGYNTKKIKTGASIFRHLPYSSSMSSLVFNFAFLFHFFFSSTKTVYVYIVLCRVGSSCFSVIRIVSAAKDAGSSTFNLYVWRFAWFKWPRDPMKSIFPDDDVFADRRRYQCNIFLYVLIIYVFFLYLERFISGCLRPGLLYEHLMFYYGSRVYPHIHFL